MEGDESGESNDDLQLSLLNVSGEEGPEPGSLRLFLDTTRGRINAIGHPVEGGTGAIVCSGMVGPAGGVYGRLPTLLRPYGITVLRLAERVPSNLEECVLDVLAGCSFLQGVGAEGIVVLGHSFGGAVAVGAGGLHPLVKGIVAMSSQLHGTRKVHLHHVPLLLVHGGSDGVLHYDASEDIYARANDPKRLELYEEAGHSLMGIEDRLDALLTEWIPARLAGEPMVSSRMEHPRP